MGSGRLRQPEQLGGGLAPERIDQPRFEQRCAETEIAGLCMIAAAGGDKGYATEAACLDDYAANLAIAGNRMLPEDDPGTESRRRAQGRARCPE